MTKDGRQGYLVAEQVARCVVALERTGGATLYQLAKIAGVSPRTARRYLVSLRTACVQLERHEGVRGNQEPLIWRRVRGTA